MNQFNIVDKALLLKETKLFEELDLDFLLAVSEKMNLVSYKPEEIIFQSGQQAHRMYIIIAGTIEIHETNNKRKAKLNKYDFFGDEAILNERTREYKAICKGEVQLLTLSLTHLLEIISENPSVAIALLRTYAQNCKFRERS